MWCEYSTDVYKRQAREQSKVAFQTGGKLTQIAVKEGDVVQKGQYLASLDQRQLQKSLQKELNDYMKARWTFDQNKDCLLYTSPHSDQADW